MRRSHRSRVSRYQYRYIFTGLPPGTEVGPFLYAPVEFMGHMVTPSGVDQNKNAYILNVHTQMGGYIDALALDVSVNRSRADDDDELTPRRRRLDENPSACAHLVNHSSRKANVRVVPFIWVDVLPDYKSGDDDFFDLPNIVRTDGAPRFFQVHGSEMIFYEKGEPSFSVLNVCGAVFCASTDISAGDELLLNYGLRKPLPSWAAQWYDQE